MMSAMLTHLRIQGYAVIDDLTLTLSPGLNALTGETGAGKSIVAGALSLLLGERASADVVRAGAARAVVEGAFDLSGRGDLVRRLEGMGVAADDGLLILRREVLAEGRNRSWINGSPATAGMVGALGSELVDLHGQHEHQTLLRAAEQRRILDAFGGLAEQVKEVERLHRGLEATREAVERRRARAREIHAQVDFLRFQVGEIDAAAPADGEEERIAEEARRLEHARELTEDAERLHEALYGGEDALSDRLGEARAVLDRLTRLDPSLGDLAGGLETAYHQVVEVGRSLGRYAEHVEQDPGRLEALRRRQEVLFRLKRKYGPTLADVVETGRRVRAELAELEGAEEHIGELEARLAAERTTLHAAARRLGAGRAKAAGELAGAVRRVLPELGMPGARFEVELTSLPEPGAGGAESVAFLVAVNAGFEPRPLAKVASGGELSRVMLALKSILARVDEVPTLVFDEIDAGVGGVVAAGVAAKLREIAGHHQVLVITHLPQLASSAHAHLRVEKAELSGATITRVTHLEGEERVREIARMLGGDPDSVRSRDHARELLEAV
jgi:DNA repair protein RecN (Recombination protein N)